MEWLRRTSSLLMSLNSPDLALIAPSPLIGAARRTSRANEEEALDRTCRVMTPSQTWTSHDSQMERFRSVFAADDLIQGLYWGNKSDFYCHQLKMSVIYWDNRVALLQRQRAASQIKEEKRDYTQLCLSGDDLTTETQNWTPVRWRKFPPFSHSPVCLRKRIKMKSRSL